MATLKSLLDATIKAGSKFALPAVSATSVSFLLSDGGTYTAPSDGWLRIRFIQVTFYSAHTGLHYIEIGVPNVSNFEVCIPLRKGTTVTVLFNAWKEEYPNAECVFFANY